MSYAADHERTACVVLAKYAGQHDRTPAKRMQAKQARLNQIQRPEMDSAVGTLDEQTQRIDMRDGRKIDERWKGTEPFKSERVLRLAPATSHQLYVTTSRHGVAG